MFAQTTVDQVTREGEQRADSGAAEQQRVEQVADQTDKILADYKTVSKVVDGLLVYNSLLQRQIDNQEREKTGTDHIHDQCGAHRTPDPTDDDPYDRLRRAVY